MTDDHEKLPKHNLTQFISQNRRQKVDAILVILLACELTNILCSFINVKFSFLLCLRRGSRQKLIVLFF